MANGLLGNLQPSGLLGPVTMNPNIAAQGRNALASALRGSPRNALLDPEFYTRDLAKSAVNYFSDPENSLRALSIAPVPGLSDAAGLAADALMYKNKPESRNMFNFGLTGLGLLPFVPAMATVWHGSPHKFDKFDMSKIGTGEGAQAYGHGLYFAESPDVARSYQNTLSKYGEIRFNDGSKISVPDLPYNSSEQIAGQIWMNNPELSKAKFALSNYDSKYLGAPKEAVAAELEKLASKGASLSGSFYKVDLPDEHIAKMLDWDKPLSQQPQNVRDAFKTLMDAQGVQSYVADGQRVYLGVGEEVGMTGADIYRKLGASTPENASGALRQLGIPGIRYLDGGSRGAGQGTSNYVVFDDQLPKILGRE